ncbi:MAG: hypothetical protein KC609_19465 [Myxococcales bacterium]|nr:hypothetical protein [Myxococcales bacterium]
MDRETSSLFRGEPGKLIAYSLIPSPPELRPARGERDWMEQTHERFANRCLPLLIANMHGWELLSPTSFTARWDGRAIKQGVSLRFDDGPSTLVHSHFGSGIVTFSTGYLFITPPGVNLWVKGPTNRPKDGISPLEGIVESDWSTAPFTMNWKLTRADHEVRFEAGEPCCTILPIARGYIESLEPEIRPLAQDAELDQAYRSWRESRSTFLADLTQPQSDARQKKWQKDYFRGIAANGAAFEEHQTRLHLRPFQHAPEREKS